MARWLIRASIALVVALAIFAVWVLDRTGQLRSLEPRTIGECRRVEGAPGAEDMALDRAAGRVFVSSLDRRALAAGEAVNGRIFAYDLESEKLSDVSPRQPAVFRPHGISLYDDGAERLLFVVNHPSATEHSVEILRFEDGRLHHVESVRDELLVTPNDVVAMGRRAFYATNDHGAAAGWRRFAEEALDQARGDVVFWDGESMTRVAEGLAYPNGIAASLYGGEVYVAATTRRVLYVFARDAETGELGRPYRMPVDVGLDNITIDRHGMLWIAGHPKLLTHFRYRRGMAVRSPSQVLWVDTDEATDPPVRPVYLDLGDEISAASVAVPIGDRLLIGSVYESFVDCRRSS